jgi:hypothetical protein
LFQVLPESNVFGKDKWEAAIDVFVKQFMYFGLSKRTIIVRVKKFKLGILSSMCKYQQSGQGKCPLQATIRI